MIRPALFDGPSHGLSGVLLLTGTVCAAMMIAWLALDALDAPPPLPEVIDLPGPAGVPLKVAGEPGLRPLPLGPRTYVAVVGANPVHETTVSLCDQATNPTWKNDNSRMVPLRGGMAWEEIEAQGRANEAAGRRPHEGIKNPLLDSAAWPVPEFTIHTPSLAGTLDDLPGNGAQAPQPLRLHVAVPDSAWLVSDTASPVPHADPGARLFLTHAWMLWRSDVAPLGSYPDRAIQVRREARDGCRYGALRFTAWAVDAASAPDSARLIGLGIDAAGTWRIPLDHPLVTGQPDQGEAGDLFADLLAAELLRQADSGALVLAPRDAAAVQTVRKVDPALVVTGKDFAVTDHARRILLERTYHSPAGAAVRAAIARFNAARLLAAIRFQGALPERRHVTLSQYTAPPLSDAMPDRAGVFFDAPPVAWSGWLRVAEWADSDDTASPVRFGWSMAEGEARTVLVVANGYEVSGPVKVNADVALCAPAPCRKGDTPVAHRLTLKAAAAGEAMLTVRPWARAEQAYLFAHEHPEILADAAQITWRTQPQGDPIPSPEVSVVDRHGKPVFARSGTRDTLLDPRAALGQSLPETLARLQRGRREQIAARVTLDADLQAQARAVLAEGMARASTGYKGKDRYRDDRFGSLLLIDTGNGDVLAAASAPEIDPEVAAGDLRAYAESHAARDPRLFRPWQHNGLPLTPAASTFKLVVALALEQAAQHDPALAAELDGLDASGLRVAGHRDGYAYHPDAPCYPADAKSCRWPGGTRTRQPGSIQNYTEDGYQETASGQMKRWDDRVYGLEQALRDSLNTQFAWWLERIDRSLLGQGDTPGLAGIDALTPGAFDAPRPWMAIAHRLGFGQALRLDGGLLADTVAADLGILAATPARIDPIHDRQGIRRAALGARMQVTPLQMAVVAASIAEGSVVRPRLLLELDGDDAAAPDFAPLDMPLDRIRRGMKRVPVDGTARSVFNQDKANAPYHRYRYLRDAVYAKTGTLALRDTPGAGPNAAWFIGWVEPGIVPGLDRRLAFACMISHSARTGGAECAPVVAELLHRVASREVQPAS